jgi:hypothetical protein
MNIQSNKIASGSLLVEWPSSRQIKQVSFAEYSNCNRYLMNAEYEKTKSYSSSDRKSFKQEAVRDAARLRMLLDLSPFEGAKALIHLIKGKMILPEELIGIEDLLMDPLKVACWRREHSAHVLKMQRALRAKEESEETSVAKLALGSEKTSLKSTEKARLRAALAVE